MAKNRRKIYEDDSGDGATPCPDCGCCHREEIARFDDGRTTRVTRICRNCGREFVTIENVADNM